MALNVVTKSAMITIMRSFFVLGMLLLTTQTIHIGYLRWFGASTIIFDTVDGKISKNTAEAASFDDLVRSHREALAKIKIYEDNESNPVLNRLDRENTEPYASEMRLISCIESWKKQDKLIIELRYYCAWGVIFVLLGILAFKRIDEYVGLSFLLVGFCELIGYTGGLNRYPTVDYIPLLNEQILYLLSSILILLMTAYYLGIIRGQYMNEPYMDMADDEETVC